MAVFEIRFWWLTFSGANLYEGSTAIVNGSLIVGGSLSGLTSVTVAVDGLYGVAADDQVGAIAGAGQIQLGVQTLTAGNTSNSEFSGVISGQTGGLTKVGSGELVLSGDNTYGGTTLVQDGTLTVTGSAQQKRPAPLAPVPTSACSPHQSLLLRKNQSQS